MTSIPESSQCDSCNAILYDDGASGCQVGATGKVQSFPRKWNEQRSQHTVFPAPFLTAEVGRKSE